MFLKGGLELVQKLTAAGTDEYTFSSQAQSLGLPENLGQILKEIMGDQTAPASIECDLTNGEYSVHMNINTRSGL